VGQFWREERRLKHPFNLPYAAMKFNTKQRNKCCGCFGKKKGADAEKNKLHLPILIENMLEKYFFDVF